MEAVSPNIKNKSVETLLREDIIRTRTMFLKNELKPSFPSDDLRFDLCVDLVS